MISLYRDSILLITWDSLPEAAYFVLNAFSTNIDKSSFHISMPMGNCSKIFSIDEFLNNAYDQVVRNYFNER